MVWSLLRYSLFGLYGLAAWLAILIVFFLPQSSPGWIPFWGVVFFGLLGLVQTAKKFQQNSQWPRSRIAIGFSAVAAIGLGLTLVLGNEVVARRNGDWDWYLTVLGLGLLFHGSLLTVLLRQTRTVRA